MTVQVAGLREPEQAEFALVRLFTRVYAQVLGERGRVAERLLAQSAPVRPLARVGAHVRGDGRRLREPAVADLAPERLFAGVRANVRRQIGRLAERLVAVVAPVRFLAGVRAEVRLQRAGARVGLSTDPAQVWPATVLADRGCRSGRRTVHAGRHLQQLRAARFPVLAVLVDLHR